MEEINKMENLRKKFDEFYTDGVKNGRIPLEFAGPKGKEVLEHSFMYGVSCILIDMLLSSMSRKGGPDVTGT